MNLGLFGLIVPDLAEVDRLGPAHPKLGAFLDAGSFGTVRDVGGGPAALAAMLGEELATAAGAAGVDCTRWPLAGHRPELRENAVVVFTPWLEPDGAAAGDDPGWHSWLAAGGILSLVVADTRGMQAPFWVLCGHRLPALGPVGDVTRDDAWATWLRLAGGRAPAGRFLLDEPESELDPEGGEALTERLRQLYGE